MKTYAISPKSFLKSLYVNRELIFSLVKRDVVERYRGSLFGLLWSFFTPVFMLLVYTFVFSVVFQSRWAGGRGSKTEFALILFAGLVVFNFFSECCNRAPSLIVSNPNYVKKVVFPLETLAWVAVGSALFHACTSLIVWIVFYTIEIGAPHFTVFLLPVVLLPLAMLSLGVTWFLSSLGVYVRDVGQLVGVVTTVIMFLSPIFFPISALPVAYRGFVTLNPLVPVIEQMRNVLYWGVFKDVSYYFVYTAVSMVFAWLGFVWFQKTRKGFADVL